MTKQELINMKHFLITTIIMIALVGCGGAEERKSVYLEKARLSLDAGDLDKARIELKNVLQIDPKEAQAYFQLGDIYNLKKEYRKAYGNYSKAVELDPDNLEYHAKIGTYHLILAGDIDAAIEKKDLILGKDVTNVNGLLLKAGILYKQNDALAAEKIVQDIFSRQPEHVQNAQFLSSLYLSNKKYDDSINVLNACIKLNPNNGILKNLLANAYLSAGKYDQAEKEYKAILNQKPEVFSNHLTLAMFYRQIDKADKAEEVLRNAIDEDDKDLERKLVLVDFIQQTRGNLKAIEELKSFIEKNTKMVELWFSLGKLYVTENNLIDAEKIFKSAASDFPEDSVVVKSRIYLANLYMRKKNIDAATSVIDDAYKISPNDAEVNFIKAKLQMLNKGYEGAIISLRIVVKDDPENMEAYFLLSNALRANGGEEQATEIIDLAYENNRANAEGLMSLARYHARNKNKVQLEKVIDNYLSIDANNYEALSYKSTLLNDRKMFSEVKPYSSRMIELYPDMPNGYIQSVPYMLTEKRENEAVSLLERGYKRVSEKNRILELLALIHVSKKSFDVAISKVKSAIRENGETAELYMLLARVQIASGRADDAKTSLIKVMDTKPDWNEPYLQLANIYIKDKDNQKAIEVLHQGLAALKSDLKLTLGLTRIYEGLGDYNAAINEYEKALEKNSNAVVLANNLAALLSEYRKDEDSLKRAKQLADKLKNVDQVLILDTVGWVYYKTGDYSEAVAVLKSVVEKSPEVPVFNYHLGMALYKTGDEVSAKAYLTNSLANNGNFPGKADAEIQLQKFK